MALSATFTANFASFYDAVDKADAKLKDFGEGADKVGRRLDTLSNQFSGRAIVQEATIMAKAVEEIGGVSKLTEKELQRLGATTNQAVEKMKALGMDVPKNLQKIADETKDANKASIDWLGTLSKMAGAVGIAFSVGSVVNFVGKVFDAADAIKDQADAVGMGVEAFQRIKSAVEAGGGTMEAFTAAANKLNDNLATGSRSTVSALKAVGLEFQTIRGMKPEDAFVAVSDAVGQIEDPMERARIAQDLFGKGAIALLPGMIQGYKDVAANAKVMSEETIARLKAAKSAWEEFAAKVTIVTGEILGTTMKNVSTMTSSWSNFFGTIAAGMGGGSAGVEAYLKKLQAGTDAQAAADKKAAAEKAALAKATANVTFRTEEQTEADKKAAAAAEEHRKKIQALTESLSGAGLAQKVRDLSDAYARLTPAQVQNLDTMLRLAEQARQLRDAGATLTAQLRNIVDQATVLNEVLEAEAEAVFLAYDAEQAREWLLSKTSTTLGTLTDKQKEQNAAMAAAMLHTGEQILGLEEYNRYLADQAYRQSVANAETVNAAAAEADATAAAEEYKRSISELAAAFAQLSQISGGALGGVAGDIATTIGAMDAASKSTATFKKGLKAFDDGNVTQGLASTAAGAVGVVGAFQSATKETGKLQSTLNGAAIGFSVAGPWGAAVGAGIGLIKGFFNAAKERKEVLRMRDDVVSAAGGMEEFANRARAAGVSLKDFYAANTKSGLEQSIKDITAAFEYQEKALALVTETAQKYGFTLEELGPALQRQELDKQAQQIFKDFEVLNAAGIDAVAITERMSEAVSDYVQDAIAMGIEVPAAMRPMLEAFARSGHLLDENGNAITDLEEAGISFTLSMSEGFRRLIEEVQHLTAVIAGSTTAMHQYEEGLMEQYKDWQVPTWTVPKTKYSWQDAPVESYQEGSDGFRDFGQGTPVMLHGVEAVVPYDESRSAGSFATVADASVSGAAWAPASTSIVINAQGAFFDTPGDLQRLADRVNDALTAKYGLRTAMRAG